MHLIETSVVVLVSMTLVFMNNRLLSKKMILFSSQMYGSPFPPRIIKCKKVKKRLLRIVGVIVTVCGCRDAHNDGVTIIVL